MNYGDVTTPTLRRLLGAGAPPQGPAGWRRWNLILSPGLSSPKNKQKESSEKLRHVPELNIIRPVWFLAWRSLYKVTIGGFDQSLIPGHCNTVAYCSLRGWWIKSGDGSSRCRVSCPITAGFAVQILLQLRKCVVCPFNPHCLSQNSSLLLQTASFQAWLRVTDKKTTKNPCWLL